MPQVSVRVAGANEYDQLAATYRLWGYDAGISPADVVYVAESGNRVVGLVRRTFEHSRTMLRGMQVDPAHQRAGVGMQLLARFMAELAGDECFCIPFSHLTTFYGRVGFAVVSAGEAPAFLGERLEEFRREGHDVLIMRRATDGRDLDHASR